jgi:hypothetical protein
VGIKTGIESLDRSLKQISSSVSDVYVNSLEELAPQMSSFMNSIYIESSDGHYNYYHINNNCNVSFALAEMDDEFYSLDRSFEKISYKLDRIKEDLDYFRKDYLPDFNQIDEAEVDNNEFGSNEDPKT